MVKSEGDASTQFYKNYVSFRMMSDTKLYHIKSIFNCTRHCTKLQLNFVIAPLTSFLMSKIKHFSFMEILHNLMCSL